MKKKTIWTIAIIMGFSFLALLFLQLSYIQEMVNMKKEQFDESVNRALYQASRNLELNETLRYLEKDVNEAERKANRKDSVGTRSGQPADGTVQHSHQYSVVGKDGTVYSSFELKTIATNPANKPKAMILRSDRNSLSETQKSLQEIVKNRYVYQKALLDEVVYSILYSASDKPLKERINFKQLDQDLKAEMMNNGINIPYHFTVTTQDGREVYRCPDFSDEGEEYSYSQVLFRNDPQSKMGVVKVHFPDMNSYIFSSVRFMIPRNHEAHTGENVAVHIREVNLHDTHLRLRVVSEEHLRIAVLLALVAKVWAAVHLSSILRCHREVIRDVDAVVHHLCLGRDDEQRHQHPLSLHGDNAGWTRGVPLPRL